MLNQREVAIVSRLKPLRLITLGVGVLACLVTTMLYGTENLFRLSLSVAFVTIGFLLTVFPAPLVLSKRQVPPSKGTAFVVTASVFSGVIQTFAGTMMAIPPVTVTSIAFISLAPGAAYLAGLILIMGKVRRQ